MRLKESLLSRRGFITGFICAGLGVLSVYIAAPVMKFLFHKKRMPLPKAVTILRTDIDRMGLNTACYFKYGYLPALLLKTENGEIRAFSAKCTHLDCTVQYQPGSKKFFCACHDGYFNDKGINISGPPPAPLAVFNIKEQGDTIIVSMQKT